jgi:hypothetical protein
MARGERRRGQRAWPFVLAVAGLFILLPLVAFLVVLVTL